MKKSVPHYHDLWKKIYSPWRIDQLDVTEVRQTHEWKPTTDVIHWLQGACNRKEEKQMREEYRRFKAGYMTGKNDLN